MKFTFRITAGSATRFGSGMGRLVGTDIPIRVEGGDTFDATITGVDLAPDGSWVDITADGALPAEIIIGNYHPLPGSVGFE